MLKGKLIYVNNNLSIVIYIQNLLNVYILCFNDVVLNMFVLFFSSYCSPHSKQLKQLSNHERGLLVTKMAEELIEDKLYLIK